MQCFIQKGVSPSEHENLPPPNLPLLSRKNKKNEYLMVGWEGPSRAKLGKTSSPPVLCCTMQGVVWEVCAVTTFLTRRDVVPWQHLCTPCEFEVSS